MKNQILVLFLSLITFGATAQKVQWLSMEEALEKQATSQNPKKIFVDVYTKWCGPCKMLERNTFGNLQVAKYINTHFYPVKFNAEGNEEFTYKGTRFTNPNYRTDAKGRNSTHQFTRALKVRGYPTMLFMDEGANMILPISGYYKPSQLEIFLKLIASDDYIKINTQELFEEYEQNFQGTFRD